MNSKIIGIWLIDRNGLPLLNRMYDSESLVDSALFSGFITAIVTYSKQVVDDHIETIEMAGHNIHYMQFDLFSVVVVATSIKGAKITNLTNLMSSIGNQFQSLYDKELKGIERTTKLFEAFGSVCDDLIGELGGKKKSLNNFEIGFILTQLKLHKITPQEAISQIYSSFQKLDKDSQKFIREAMKDFEHFFSQSNLSDEEVKMYKEIVKKMTVLMKSEKFFSSF